VHKLSLQVTRLAHGTGLPVPAYATAGSAGIDLAAAVERDLVLAPGGSALVPTGFSVALPKGYEGQIRPRSGLALRHGVTVLNSPGTIDADYRGEVGVIVINLGSKPFAVRRGERIAQMIVAPVARVQVREAKRLPASRRGVRGFGSTG
jgi:dUTP pyrophosphatase